MSLKPISNSLDPTLYFSDEINLKIISFLDLKDLHAVILTNKYWCRLGNDYTVWKELFKKHFTNVSIDKSLDLDWKVTFKPYYTILSSRFAKELKKCNLKLYEFYKKNGVFLNPSKGIEVDIESLNGLYGVNLDEVEINYWGKNRSLNHVSLNSCLNVVWPLNFPSYNNNDAPESISFRDAISFVVRLINFKIDALTSNKEVDEFKLEYSNIIVSYIDKKNINRNTVSTRLIGIPLSHPVCMALTNIEYLQEDQITSITKIEGVTGKYISWLQVICKILRDKNLIFDIFYTRIGLHIQC